MKIKKNFTSTNKENVTMYDEFVCTAFNWLPINKQKENAKKLEQMTRDDENIE